MERIHPAAEWCAVHAVLMRSRTFSFSCTAGHITHINLQHTVSVSPDYDVVVVVVRISIV